MEKDKINRNTEDFNTISIYCRLKFIVHPTMRKTNSSADETFIKLCWVNFLYSDHSRIELEINNNVTFRKIPKYGN